MGEETAAYTSEDASEAINRAIHEHCKGVGMVFPGTLSINIDRDVRLRPWGKVLHSGLYHFTHDEEHPDDMSKTVLYYASVDFETLREQTERQLEAETAERIVNDDGTEEIHGHAPASVNVTLTPIVLPGADRPLSVIEAFVWAAINDAEESGDADLARAILSNAYRQEQAGGEILPEQDTNRPVSHVQGISKLSEKITEVSNGETVLLEMGGENEARGTVITPLSLTYEGEGIEISKPVTPYDKEVHNAVATLWAAGNRVITARQVYQTMTGSQSKPRESAIANVVASLDKQRRTFVTIDYSKELRGKTATFDGETVTAEQCHYETYMLEADKIRVRAVNGSEVAGYSISSAPVLYRHDCTTGQIISYPQSLLEAASKAVSNTDTTLLMRSYLIKRIKTMSRKGSKLSRQIRYDAIYAAAGKQGASRTQRNRMSTTVKTLLDVFTSEGLIDGWSEYADKGSSHRLIGVTIKTARHRR